MNWKLILKLSLIGLFMGICTVFITPVQIEPFLWIGVFVVCAVIIAKQAERKHFLNGLLANILMSTWVSLTHIIWLEKYLSNHIDEAKMIQTQTWSDSSVLKILLMGIGIGVIGGIILGVLSLVARKLFKDKNT